MHRRAAKRDESEPAIVDALEQAGCLVYRALPCDLLVHRQEYGPGMFRAIEVKTPRLKSGAARKRNDQVSQDAFLADTGTVKVTTPEAALQACLPAYAVQR